MPMETITDDPELRRAGFYWRVVGGVQALICAPLEQDGFANGFSTRLGGVSAMPEHALNLAGFNEDAAENILENRERFLKLFPGHWTLTGCWQVHGADIRWVKDAEDAQPMPGALGDTVYCDALISSAPGVLLGVKTADCVSILLGDAVTGAFAAVHAGWRGTLAGIAEKALADLKEKYGTKAADVRAAIGPAAAVCCYEVGPEVVGAFRERFPESDELFFPTANGHARIDLWRANREQLVGSGVPGDRIHISPLCTMCRSDLFFSYRREKSCFGKVGRLMAVVGKSGDRD
jgi:purine-nucleoside/S-methyl-5'-thioadenosine phosphorylase / adenosine deaminase